MNKITVLVPPNQSTSSYKSVSDLIRKKVVIEMVSGSRIQGVIKVVSPTHIELDTGVAVLQHIALISIVDNLPGSHGL